jgi:hypothetical protein
MTSKKIFFDIFLFELIIFFLIIDTIYKKINQETNLNSNDSITKLNNIF